jgi:hypothetical protein
MRKTIGGFRRRQLEYPAFFYAALFAFVGDALNTIQEKKWPDFGYSHPTLQSGQSSAIGGGPVRILRLDMLCPFRPECSGAYAARTLKRVRR